MLYLVFFLSGFAALIYQVVWQRTLFSIYGINIESVTMVVTAFMLGLGIGSLIGGEVSKNPKRPAILLFSIVEAAIGVFGLVSLAVFRGVGAATLLMSPLMIGIVTFCLVLVPTMLMGSTLPLLVAHVTRISGNVGRSVSSLYTINTLGSALASFVAVIFSLRVLHQSGSVQFAAAFNFAASILAYAFFRAKKADGTKTLASTHERAPRDESNTKGLEDASASEVTS